MTQQHAFLPEYWEPELLLSQPHACGYLPDPMAATLYVDPTTPMDMAKFEYLLSIGFRRSGTIVYRPWCAECTACIPVRLPVAAFNPSRSLRRIIKRNQDLTVHQEEPVFTAERFDLYRRYLNSRHADGPMANPSETDFYDFLHSEWCTVRFIDFRLQGRLLLTAVMDQLPNTLSAVYSFFDPDENHRSLGSYAILWEIEQALRLGLPWLYLGYWIADSQKMRYKSRFQPLEAYILRQWRLLPEQTLK
ncbi:MAG: arginyltransferase [Magnetococcales bacterium]|nr:arginyltransferase [Magnetococcales bacterium]MBF0439039.1 arginyltransferase [Magnetococcales bacterium]